MGNKSWKVFYSFGPITPLLHYSNAPFLSLFQVVILKRAQLVDIIVLKVKIWIDADFFGQSGDLWEYVYAITVFSSFICFMDNQKRIIADQKSDT